MRHRKAGLKLNRTASHRKAMFRNMVTSLLKYERIRTTDTKAKELRKWADHIITLAKRGDLHARRQALAIVTEKDVVHKLFETAAQRFGTVNGGYTRVIKLGRRAGDAAPLSMIELVVIEEKKKTKKKKKAKPVAAKTTGTKKGKSVKKSEKPKAEAEAVADDASAEESALGTQGKGPAKKRAAKKIEAEAAAEAAPTEKAAAKKEEEGAEKKDKE